jgi:Heparinase II/III-like protein
MAADPFSRFRNERPRLMATPKHIERLKKAIAGDPVGEGLKDEIIRKADKYVEKEPPPPSFAPRESDDFLDVCRQARKRLQTLGLAWALVPEKRYVTRAKQELDAVCEFADWNPVHFLDTAELTHAMAIGYDWFHSQWSDSDRKEITAAIIEKGLKPGYEHLSHGPKRAWPNQATNWNIVCNSALMIGALAVWGEGKSPEFPKQVFLRCLDSVPTGFSGYSPDGSWDEGPGYWAYATEYAAYLLSALDTALGHEFGLASLPGFSRSGFFRMHAQGSAVADETNATKFFNFSDSQEVRSGSWAMRWLYHRFGHTKPFDAYNLVALADAQKSPMDLFWYSGDRTTLAGIPRNVVFRGIANVAMLRGYWQKRSGGSAFRPWVAADAGDVYLGIRAGENRRDGVHAHLDLGSFVLDALQVRWAVDIPPFGKEGSPHKRDYKLPGYFDVDLERRFRYYRTGTVGHNTLVVNGFNQPLGVQTEIIGFGQTSEDNPDLVVVVLDLTAAYPDCLRVRRGFALIEQRHVLIVDEFTPKEDLNALWQMHTGAAAEVLGPVVRLTQQQKQFFVRLLEPAGGRWKIQKARVMQPKEAPNENVQKLVAILPDVKHPTRISVYLSALQDLNAPLPEPLPRPLWAWIEWTEKEHPAEKGKTSY